MDLLWLYFFNSTKVALILIADVAQILCVDPDADDLIRNRNASDIITVNSDA